MNIERIDSVAEVFETKLRSLKLHYTKDDRFQAIFNRRKRRGEFDSQRRALEKILYASSLDDMGIPKDSEEIIFESCSAIVGLAFEQFPEAMTSWVKAHENVNPISDNHTDKRVRMIVEIAKERLT
jgi:hypothetical protein